MDMKGKVTFSVYDENKISPEIERIFPEGKMRYKGNRALGGKSSVIIPINSFLYSINFF